MKRNMNLKYILATAFALPLGLLAQGSHHLEAYRAQVRNYSKDLRAAVLSSRIKQEQQQSAKADFLPSLCGQAHYQYTGQPLRLSKEVPGLAVPIELEGRHQQYGATLTLAQPLYMGGVLKAKYEKAKTETTMSQLEIQRITNDLLYDADVHYWNKVARQEMTRVAGNFRQSVASLVEVVKERVEEGYTDRNDLLMAEVKLNDADFRLVQARNDEEVARLALHSFAGVPSDSILVTDSLLCPVPETLHPGNAQEDALMQRPEIHLAESNTNTQKSAAQIANANFRPHVSIGIDGSYTAPGYDFRSDLDPNYAIYAKLSIPIYEWGKRENTRQAGKHAISIALENEQKVRDQILLETETACCNLQLATDKVKLTEKSLEKAAESEQLATDKYKEGEVSIVEVINAQLFHLEAQINHIQSKLNAQIAYSALCRARGAYL